MKLKTTILILGASAVLAVPSVALAGAPHAGPARTTTLIAKGSKGHVTLSKRGVLKVEFRSVATDGGYHWAIKSNKTGVVKETGKATYVKVSSCKAGEVGCAENEFISLRAVRKGTGKVTFELLPPGKSAKPSKTYILTATVS